MPPISYSLDRKFLEAKSGFKANARKYTTASVDYPEAT